MTGFIALGMFLIGCGCGVLIGLMAGHGIKPAMAQKAANTSGPKAQTFPPLPPYQFMPGPSSSYYWQIVPPAPKKQPKKSAPKIGKGAKKK